MGQGIENLDTRSVRPWSWRRLLVVGVVVFAVFVTASYLFDWTWTGFPESRVWDWLNLLIRPVALTAAAIWFTSHPKWHREWTVPLVMGVVAFVLFVSAAYIYHWKWTGFPGNRLWDWLNLLLLLGVNNQSSFEFFRQKAQQFGRLTLSNAQIVVLFV